MSADLKILIEHFHFMRKLITTPPFSDIIGEDLLLGAEARYLTVSIVQPVN